MRKLKHFFLLLVVLIAAFAVYVEIDNRNSKNMTYRQKVLKTIYPLVMLWGKISGKGVTALSNQSKEAPVSFYTLKAKLNNGDTLDFASLQGKKVMLVNTASDCGYTNQYDQLQELSEQYKDKLVVLGFPANDFKEEEKGSDQEIAAFCKINYGVSFPLMSKSTVIRSDQQHPVYQWLTDSSKNGWNKKQPGWNFCKYIVDEKGRLIHYFGSSISPLSKDVVKAIE
ncbi:MAG TPA: glutathione peroxidase [Chitinophagaceae bacterium]|nr:glutathione peroxidase [Chitinophagaceae bacterium]